MLVKHAAARGRRRLADQLEAENAGAGGAGDGGAGLAGEARAAYLYCRTGEMDAVRDYVTTRLADQFFVLDSTAALEAGLFGTGKIAAEVKYRIGDLILLPRENFYLWDRRDEPRLRGRHGGLAEKEMLVPLLISRLDN